MVDETDYKNKMDDGVGVGGVRLRLCDRQVNKSGLTRGGKRDVIGPCKLRKSGTHPLFGSCSVRLEINLQN